MINKSLLHFLLFSVIVLLLFSGCTGFRSVSEGKHLYAGYTLEIDSVQFIEDFPAVKTEIKELFLQKPNKKFLWMRPSLCIYHLSPDKKKEKGFWHWIKYKIGEPPSYLEEINEINVSKAIENRLQNRGNFRATVYCEIINKRKTGMLKFNLSPGKPYTLQTILYPQGNAEIEGDIRNQQKESLVQLGNIYNLQQFDNERQRIEKVLKTMGYYYFKSDYLLFTADTTVGNRKIRIWLDLKKDIPPEASVKYRFNNIYVYDDYSLREYQPDTLRLRNYNYVSEKHLFKPETILDAVFIEKDSLYSQVDHHNTLRHLMGLGVYKFVNARFTTDDKWPGKMDASIYLTPIKKISLSAEMNAAINTNNYAGPGLNLNYKNNNVFKGAELLSVTLGGKFETQISGDSKGQTSYSIALDGSYTLPRFEPFSLADKSSRMFVPKTIIAGGIGFFSRVNLYQLNSFNTSLSYKWKPNEQVTHLFSPLEISYSHIAKSTIEFQDYLNENPTVKKSFEEQFIVGGSYTIGYSPKTTLKSRHSFYMSESIDLAGNILSGIATVTTGASPSSETPQLLLGLPYSQFIRLRNEMRYNFRISKKTMLAMRLIAGVGIPYGNSSTMPYVRQYFVGGTNSIRAFIARSVGPGTYRPPDSVSNIFVDQAGDMKLEYNIEYRFDIYKVFKSAVFVDAGNIWLVNDDPQRAGGKFNSKTFIGELAVGSGIGFRFDFSFVVVRFDVAFPLKKPYLPESERWVVDKIALGSHSWRKQNLVWNIAIGYPF